MSEPRSAHRGGEEAEGKVGCPSRVAGPLRGGGVAGWWAAGAGVQTGLCASSGPATSQCSGSMCGCNVPPFKMGRMWKCFSLQKGRKGPWMNLEDIVLRGRSQTEKDRYCTILLPCRQVHRLRTQRGGCQRWEGGRVRGRGVNV